MDHASVRQIVNGSPQGVVIRMIDGTSTASRTGTTSRWVLRRRKSPRDPCIKQRS